MPVQDYPPYHYGFCPPCLKWRQDARTVCIRLESPERNRFTSGLCCHIILNETIKYKNVLCDFYMYTPFFGMFTNVYECLQIVCIQQESREFVHKFPNSTPNLRRTPNKLNRVLFIIKAIL